MHGKTRVEGVIGYDHGRLADLRLKLGLLLSNNELTRATRPSKYPLT